MVTMRYRVNRKRRTRGRKIRKRLAQLLRAVAILILVLITVPIVFSVIYRIDLVRPVSALMVTNKIAGQPVSRHWVDIDDVSPMLKFSVLMSEDGQFCRHHGIDLGELKAVLEEALAGEKTRGASTITMQTAKNLFLWNSRSYVRKALELPLAIWLDFAMPKKRIVEIYLNIAEWGPGIYGIDQAAGFHFGAQPEALTNRQAALLAVTLPNPALRDPSRPTKHMNQLARIIEDRAQRAGGYVDCLK